MSQPHNYIQSINAADNARIHVGNTVYNSENRCIVDLRDTDPRLDKLRIEEGRGQLNKDICQWVLESPEFAKLRLTPVSQLLLINGERGGGKTMVLCGMIDELQKKGDGLAYFFCKRSDDKRNTAVGVLRGLLYTLITQQPTLLPHLKQAYDEAGAHLFHDSNAWFALSKVLESVLQDTSFTTTYFVVDAVDECTTGLSDLLQLVAKACSISQHVKWIFSGHSGIGFERILRNKDSILSLKLHSDTMMKFFQGHIRAMVEDLARKRNYDQKSKQMVEEYFMDNSDGSLLWVSSVCDRLCHEPFLHAVFSQDSARKDHLESRVSLLGRLKDIGLGEWNRLGLGESALRVALESSKVGTLQPGNTYRGRQSLQSGFYQMSEVLMGTGESLAPKSPDTRYDIFPISMTDARNFIHRHEISNIDQHFRAVEFEDQSAGLVLYGTAGSGKTQLAMYYCRRARDSPRFGGVLWLEGASLDTVNKSMFEAAQTMFTADVSQWDAEQTRAAVFRVITASKLPWLVLLDNFDDPKAYDVELVLPPGQSRSLVIITSRSKDLRRLFSPIEVTSLREDEAIKLLIGDENPDYRGKATYQSALKIIRRLGCLALAVAQAGAYISDRNMDLDFFLEQYESEQKRFHETVPLTWRYKRRNSDTDHRLVETTLTIASTWELSLDSLSGNEELRSAKTQLLVISAFFGRNTVTEDIISSYFRATNVKSRPSWMATFARRDHSFDSQMLRESIAEMGRLCLLQFYHIDSQGASWRFHPVVQDWAMHRSEDQSSQALLAADIIQHQLDDYQPTWVLSTLDSGAGRHSHLVVRPHVIACYTNCERLLPESECLGQGKTAKIALRFASFLRSDGQYEISEKLLSRVVEKSVPRSWEYCMATRQLAETMCSRGHWRRASELQEQVIQHSSEREEDLETAFLLAELAYIYQYQGSQPEAFEDHESRMNKGLELASRSYAIITAIESEDSVAASASLWLLSAIAYHRKDFLTARDFGQRVVNIRERAFGSRNLSTVDAKENLAVFLAKLGQGEEAATIHQEDRAILATAYGPNHPKTLEAERMLARAWRLCGQFGKAHQLGTEILERAEGRFGSDHHDTERAANGLWRTLVMARKFSEASEIQKKYNLRLSDADNEIFREAKCKT
ncbi:hypothetical protein N7541_002912 [Penicillium brevicompactum]|uniref:NACHT domain-containing protein n=1 Tax=Penicillium brevicompactum TaxID=5074 RepID=A0A9W9RQR5_PENBR|nr:hypothetical protein N7541_002912 [Penicillium brevicompactum]